MLKEFDQAIHLHENLKILCVIGEWENVSNDPWGNNTHKQHLKFSFSALCLLQNEADSPCFWTGTHLIPEENLGSYWNYYNVNNISKERFKFWRNSIQYVLS